MNDVASLIPSGVILNTRDGDVLMCRRIAIVGLAALLAGWAAPARADLSVSIGSTSVSLGGTGTIDVYLTSDASALSPDMINNLAFTLQITPVVGAGELQFSASQDFGYLNAGPTPGPQYVFFGDSSDWIKGQALPPPVGGSATTTVYSNDTYFGFDSTNDLNPVSLSAGTSVLLARLTLLAGTSLVHTGDVYQISLVPESGDGSQNSNFSTYFNVVDSGLNETSHVSFKSTPGPGLVTITAATVVPEPASTLTGLTGAVLLTAYGLRRRERSKAQLPEFL
jgi:hypothetical protein